MTRASRTNLPAVTLLISLIVSGVVSAMAPGVVSARSASLSRSFGLDTEESAPVLPAQNDSTGYLSVGNDRIWFEVRGQGETLVLIHDGLVCSEIWQEQLEEFAAHYRVVRYDRRGYGRSSAATGSYSNREDLLALFDHLEIDQATIIGMSSGGRLTINFALAHPDRVTALVLVGAVVDGFPYTQHFFSRGGHLPDTFPSRSSRTTWYASEDPYEVYAENTAVHLKVQQLVRDFPYRDQSVHGSSSSSGPPDIERLSEITVPTLILVGEFDIPDVHAHAGAINAGIPGSQRDIIPRAGHLIPIEQPELFNAAVLTFLGTRD